MDYQMPAFGANPARSSVCTIQNPLSVSYPPYDTMMHANASLLTEVEHLAYPIPHLNMPQSQNMLEHPEISKGHFPHHNEPLEYGAAAPPRQSKRIQPAYQLQRTSPPVSPRDFEQDLSVSASLTAARSQLDYPDRSNCVDLRPIAFVQPVYTPMSETFDFITDGPATAYANDAMLETESSPGSDTLSSNSKGVLAEPLQTQRPYDSQCDDAPLNTAWSITTFKDSRWDMARNSWHTAGGYPRSSTQVPQASSELRSTDPESDASLRRGSHTVLAPSPCACERSNTAKGFINYTLKDQKQLSEGVTRSGGLKTKLKREEKAKEKRKQLVRAVIETIATLGTDVDPDDVQHKVLSTYQRST